LLITANDVLSSLILVTLMMQSIRTCETSVLARATRCHISEDSILHNCRRENLKSYKAEFLHEEFSVKKTDECCKSLYAALNGD
jgi:hypothetical protein